MEKGELNEKVCDLCRQPADRSVRLRLCLLSGQGPNRGAASAFCPVEYPLRAPKRAPARADGDNVKARPIQEIQNRRAFLWDKRMAAKDQVALNVVDGWALAIDPIGR